jgi:hypothetical protein
MPELYLELDQVAFIQLGSLQQSVYLNRQEIGTHAVIVGSEHVSYSALMTLKHAGVKTVAMVEERPRTQSFEVVSFATKLIYGYILFTNTKVVNIAGDLEVSSVTIENDIGRSEIDL